MIDKAIDWTDEKCRITPNFTVKEALYLHAWDRIAKAEDGFIPEKLILLCEKLEVIRDLLSGAPMTVTSMFRSVAYNRFKNINPVNDVHSRSIACDFICNDIPTAEVQKILRPNLKRLEIRMERDTPTWIHIDTKLPGVTGREFIA